MDITAHVVFLGLFDVQLLPHIYVHGLSTDLLLVVASLLFHGIHVIFILNRMV